MQYGGVQYSGAGYGSVLYDGMSLMAWIIVVWGLDIVVRDMAG